MDNTTAGGNQAGVPHQVLSAASHELRGPLGVARGYLRMLQMQVGGNDVAQRAVEQTIKATDQMAALLDEISRYARLARGETPLRPTTGSLTDVLTDASGRAAALSGAEVDVRLPDGAGCWADASHTADSCAALAVALNRARLEGAKLSFRSVATGRDDSVTVLLAADFSPEETGHTRPVRLDRSGAGLTLATAELVFRLQSGSVEEHWVRDKWMGYLIRLRTRPPQLDDGVTVL